MTQAKDRNQLQNEKSPYLLQHKDNPVWWQTWGQETLQDARQQGKLIFLSIGYSTCHWCHVMERESFEQQDVANILNKFYVSIKVDREERPDLDHFYMRSVQIMGYRGGWPLSVILTPEGVPFWGGTYFPRETLKSLLLQIADYWQKNPSDVMQRARQVNQALLESHSLLPQQEFTREKGQELLRKAWWDMKENFDPLYGGFGEAPKFPPSLRLRLLMRMMKNPAFQREKEEIAQMVEKTLMGMWQGGIYDHLGGGFARYSTDEQWLVPHFEKMLYDNALLTQVYLEAAVAFKRDLYGQIARETLDYVLREMTEPEGGYDSAEDADSEGEEGRFYVWDPAEIKSLLTEDEWQAFSARYGLLQGPQFEGPSWVLHHADKGRPEEVFSPEWQSMRRKLFAAREKRPRPLKDDKILTSWNGLMISSLSQAYQVFQDKRYLHSAQACAQFLMEKIDHQGELKRRYREGESKYTAYLDDYAYLIQGLLDLYESDFDQRWFQWALDLQRRQDEKLWSEEKGAYALTDQSPVDWSPERPNQQIQYEKKSGDESGQRKKGQNSLISLEDGALPSANGVALMNLWRFYFFTYLKQYQERAQRLLANYLPFMDNYPSAMTQGLLALDFFLQGPQEIFIVGKAQEEQVKEALQWAQQNASPYKVISYMNPDSRGESPPWAHGRPWPGQGSTSQPLSVYICQQGACLNVIHELDELRKVEVRPVNWA